MAGKGSGAGGPEAKHEKALDLAEEAVGEMAQGHDREAEKLIEQSKKLDPSATEEVARDLEEGAGNPDVVKDL